jgi:retron-type reverse transcriptase
MKRVRISLDDIAEYTNLTLALHKAARGKRQREPVIRFLRDAENSLNRLAADILGERLPYGRFRTFTIHDPKRRTIHAACFEDRVFHHALINLASPVLERAMLPTSFACRPGLGVHRAAQSVHRSIRRFAWYCQIDISSYFANIDHEILLVILWRRFKGEGFGWQLQRLLERYHYQPGKGLPIGSLTSQYFANYYLDGLDRLLNGLPQVSAHVRYMDDIVWWGKDKEEVRQVLQQVQAYLAEQRRLTIKPSWRLQRSNQGIGFCGYRILPGSIRLSLRRKRRYQQRRRYWEHQYRLGHISATQLQNAYAAVHAILQGTDSAAWRGQNLRLHRPVSV